MASSNRSGDGGVEPRLYYYRDKDGNEIEFLFMQDQKAYALEVKKSASPTASDIRALSSLERAGAMIGEAAVICLCRDAVPLKKNVQALPIGIL